MSVFSDFGWERPTSALRAWSRNDGQPLTTYQAMEYRGRCLENRRHRGVSCFVFLLLVFSRRVVLEKATGQIVGGGALPKSRPVQARRHG